MRILFICHGNICRSPMAEYIMKELVKREGVASDWEIESAAVSREEIGNPVYPPARRKLAEYGIRSDGHHARRIERSDYEKYDYLIGMDQSNIRNMTRIAGGDPEKKIYKLMEFTGSGRDVADPWYTGDFEATYRDVSEGCQALLEKLKGNLAR